MDKIVLRNANVVKEVASEEAALTLEKKGFVRDGAVPRQPDALETLKVQLEEQKGQTDREKKAAKAAEEKALKYRKELEETEAKLEEASRYAEEADKKIEALTQELAGTREQLEVAVKKNAAAEKKK